MFQENKEIPQKNEGSKSIGENEKSNKNLKVYQNNKNDKKTNAFSNSMLTTIQNTSDQESTSKLTAVDVDLHITANEQNKLQKTKESGPTTSRQNTSSQEVKYKKSNVGPSQTDSVEQRKAVTIIQNTNSQGVSKQNSSEEPPQDTNAKQGKSKETKQPPPVITSQNTDSQGVTKQNPSEGPPQNDNAKQEKSTEIKQTPPVTTSQGTGSEGVTKQKQSEGPPENNNPEQGKSTEIKQTPPTKPSQNASCQGSTKQNPSERPTQCTFGKQETPTKTKQQSPVTTSQSTNTQGVGQNKTSEMLTTVPSSVGTNQQIDEETTYQRVDQKGFLLIINFMFASNEQMIRKGSEVDVGNLCNFFTKLNYDIICRVDMTKKQLLACLKHVKDIYLSKLSSQYHCFFCIIMSHGGQSGIATTDDLIKDDEIVNFFRNNTLKKFIGKPKIFMFQSCRGEDDQRKHTNNESPETVYDDSSSVIHGSPTDADILLIHATTPGCKAFRTKEGSWLIRSFLDKATGLPHAHLEDIMVHVRRDLATNTKYETQSERCQISPSTSLLTKHFYL